MYQINCQHLDDQTSLINCKKGKWRIDISEQNSYKHLRGYFNSSLYMNLYAVLKIK